MTDMAAPSINFSMWPENPIVKKRASSQHSNSISIMFPPMYGNLIT